MFFFFFFLTQMKFKLLLGALLGFSLAVSSSGENWVDEGGQTVKGMTCSALLDTEEDFVDMVQAAAKTVGGRRTGPVRSSACKLILIFFYLPSYPL